MASTLNPVDPQQLQAQFHKFNQKRKVIQAKINWLKQNPSIQHDLLLKLCQKRKAEFIAQIEVIKLQLWSIGLEHWFTMQIQLYW